ncbi:hypothetical protein BGZ97_005399, partial [Linnemannia gamsii]
IKGIPLNVKTTMAGLQGLKDIKFLSVIDLYPNYKALFTFVTTVVNIHNPSQLTLNIGTMGMEAGYKGYAAENRIGYTEIFNLRLVPGDNIVPSLLGQSFTAASAGPFGTDLTLLSPTMTLWANSSATSNPALNAGLSTLQTSVVLPQNLIVPIPPPPAYGDVWTIKVLPTTINDGIVEMTAVFNNAFLYEFSVTGDATKANSDFAFDPSFLTIGAPGGSTFDFAQFTDDFQYTLKTGESKTITFKMKLQRVGLQANMIKFLDSIIPAAAAGPMNTLLVWYMPKATIPGYPIGIFPDLNSGIYYPNTAGKITLQTGPDFALIKDWYYKEYAYTPVPVVPVAPAPEPVVSPATPSVAPSPIPSSEVIPPPIAPAA